MTARASYDIPPASLLLGLEFSPSYKREYETTAPRRGVPLVEATAIYHGAVRFCLSKEHNEFCCAALAATMRQKYPNETSVAQLLRGFLEGPDCRAFFRAMANPRHPLHDLANRYAEAVTSRLPRA